MRLLAGWPPSPKPVNRLSGKHGLSLAPCPKEDPSSAFGTFPPSDGGKESTEEPFGQARTNGGAAFCACGWMECSSGSLK